MSADKISGKERVIFENEAFSVWMDRVEHASGRVARLEQGGKVRSSNGGKEKVWTIEQSGGDGVPEYSGDVPVLKAAYDLSVHEFLQSKNPDGTLSTGREWSTIWTRDTAYSAYLGLALVDPYACMETLKKRIAVNGEIEQDTGTGGAWPVSTDRVAWGVAAWEVYLMTGDVEWLQKACRVLEESCLHDDAVITDVTGMMRGESSFLDWREQSYPSWMTPADIGESVALSTMVLHKRVREILYEMYTELGRLERADYWRDKSEKLDLVINEFFWLSYRGTYGQFIYGRGYPVLSEKVDNLGQALSVLFDVACGDRAERVVNNMPRCPMGMPCVYPFKSGDMPAYHNEAIWPLVEGMYVQAAGRVGNSKALMAGLASLVRVVLACGTNRENVHIESGVADELISSSERQLWSIAATLGAFYKGLFGLDFSVNALIFNPCVPEELEGRHCLRGIKWRGLSCDVALNGWGTRIVGCTINGEEADPMLFYGSQGHYVVEIELEPDVCPDDRVHWVPVQYDLPMPDWSSKGSDLSWNRVEGADFYRIYRNGVPVAQTEETCYKPLYPQHFSHYQVMAVSLDGRESFLNEPREHVPSDSRVETRPSGLSGDDAWVSRIEESDSATFHDLMIVQDGVYRVDVYYANGMSSLRDGNTCALRSLFLNGERVGSLVMPHLGEAGDWGFFGYSPGLDVYLERGIHKVELSYQAEDENTNCFVNDSLIKSLRFTRIHI